MDRLAPVLLVALLVTPSLTGCVVGEDPETASTEEEEGSAGRPVRVRPWRSSWTPTGMNLSITYDPGNQHAAVNGTISVRNELGHPKDHLVFFMETYEIRSITDEDGDPLEYSVTEFAGPLKVLPRKVQESISPNFQAVNVTLTGNTSPGTERTIHVSYEGWGQSTESLPASLPNEAAMQTHFGLVPIVAENATADVDFTLTHPADWTVLASGRVLSSTEAGDETTRTYERRGSYVAVTSGQGLHRLRATVNGTEVTTYYFPDMQEQAEVVHQVTQRVLQVMPELVGPYPYDHLWTVPNQIAVNAFSVPGLTFLGLSFYRTALEGVPVQFGRFTPYPGGSDAFEMVVVHEHTHNWFGHNVDGNNTDPDEGPIDIWISEGITTYLSEIVWWEVQYGEDDAEASSQGKVVDQKTWSRLLYRRSVSGVTEERGAAEPGGDYYEKAALALRALDAYGHATGRPDAVLEALRALQRREGKVQGGDGVVGTLGAVEVFEDVFGEPLDWHFKAWFLSGRLPDLAVAGVQRGDNVTVTVANHGDVRAAALVQVTTATGRELRSWGVVDAGAKGTVSVGKPAGAGDEPVVKVEVDPLQHIYETDETDNVWRGT